MVRGPDDWRIISSFQSSLRKEVVSSSKKWTACHSFTKKWDCKCIFFTLSEHMNSDLKRHNCQTERQVGGAKTEHVSGCLTVFPGKRHRSFSEQSGGVINGAEILAAPLECIPEFLGPFAFA